MITHDIIIVGGGAAGMFAAAVCAENNPDCHILVLEKNPKLLAKVQISGGGRCNLTHTCSDIRTFAHNYPRGNAELIGPFHCFGPKDTWEWFEAHGVPLVQLDDGCVFPRSDKSESVIAALRNTALSGNIELQTSTEVSGIKRIQSKGAETQWSGFELLLSNTTRVVCNKLLITTGGGAFIDGIDHPIDPCVPSLFTFKTPDSELTALAGIVVKDACLSRPGLKASGDLLITHSGISGPATLRFSSIGARSLAELSYRFDLKINWHPSQSEDHIFETLAAFRSSSPRKQIGTWSPVGLSARLWRLLVARAGIDENRPWGDCPLKSLRHIASQVSRFTLPISGKHPHREEFVTCGGIALKDVNFKTMESKLHPGLFFAGEVLDIDALTGGFNLQAAWTTGYIAAQQLTKG